MATIKNINIHLVHLSLSITPTTVLSFVETHTTIAIYLEINSRWKPLLIRIK